MRARIATLAPEKWLDSRRLKCQIVYLLFDNCENLAHRCRTRGTWAPQTFIAFHSAIVAESGLRPARAESSVHRILNRCFVRVTARHEAYAFFLLTILRSRSRWRPQLAAVCIGESFTCATWRLSVAQCCKLRRRRMRCVWALQPVVNCFAKKCLNVWSLHQFRMPQFCSPAVERALRSRFQNSSETVSGRPQQFAIRSLSRSSFVIQTLSRSRSSVSSRSWRSWSKKVTTPHFSRESRVLFNRAWSELRHTRVVAIFTVLRLCFVRVWRSSETPVASLVRVISYNLSPCQSDEASALVWTVYEMADRAPGTVYKCWAQGKDLRSGRGQFDECAYDLAEFSSASAASACRRSVLSVYLQLVGDQPAVSISMDRVKQLSAPLLLCFILAWHFNAEIDPCPTLQGKNFAALAGVSNAVQLWEFHLFSTWKWVSWSRRDRFVRFFWARCLLHPLVFSTLRSVWKKVTVFQCAGEFRSRDRFFSDSFKPELCCTFWYFSTLEDCSENLTDFPCISKFVIPRSVVSNSLEPTFCFSRWCFSNAADILATLGSTVNTCSCVSLRRLFVQSLMFVQRKFNGIDHVLFETLSLLETMLKGHEDRVLKASQLLIALGSQGVFAPAEWNQHVCVEMHPEVFYFNRMKWTGLCGAPFECVSHIAELSCDFGDPWTFRSFLRANSHYWCRHPLSVDLLQAVRHTHVRHWWWSLSEKRCKSKFGAFQIKFVSPKLWLVASLVSGLFIFLVRGVVWFLTRLDHANRGRRSRLLAQLESSYPEFVFCMALWSQGFTAPANVVNAQIC